MKINKFFMGFGMAAALSLVACSSDEPTTGGDQNKPVFSDDQAFIAVTISEQNGSRSRAEGDVNQQGPNGWYEDGTVFDESLIKTCDFYFYDEAGKYVLTSNTLWNGNGQDMPNIELKGQSVVVLDRVKEKGYPKYMVTILNKPSNFTAPLTLEEMNTKLVEISNVTTTDGAVKFIDDKKTYFTMTTTSWAGQTLRETPGTALPYYFVNELIKSDFYSSADEAKDATKGNPVKVYVERLASKAAVKLNMTPVEGLENTYSIELSVAGAGNDDEGDYVADYKLYVQIDGWHFNATPKDSYYMKNINTSWTDDNNSLGFIWNDPTYKRSYWGMSYTYDKGQTSDYNYFSYNELDGKFWEADEKGKQHAAYTAENTHGAYFVNSNYDKVTSVLLKAKVYDPNATPDESKNFVMYNGLLFKADRFGQYAISLANANVYVKDAKNDKKYIQASDYELVNEGSTGNKVYAQFVKKDGVTYYTKDAEGKYITDDVDAEIEKTNKALKETVGEGFKDGMMYYNVPIQHLRKIEKGEDGILERTFFKENLLEGDYGVVRNHYYFVKINTLQKLGTGVWNPGEDIVPQNPPKDEEYYVGAEINVLSWRIVENEVDL